MFIRFHKYQGAGNDFILLDNRDGHYSLSPSGIKSLCDRRFGIGADGLLLLGTCNGYDFSMEYFNADGKLAEMCGNGGRCLVAFAQKLQIIPRKAFFLAGDGAHEARVLEDGRIDLHMRDVSGIKSYHGAVILNTGVPHYVQFVDDLEQVDVVLEGRRIRYSEEFAAEGINVDFLSGGLEGLHIRTYERGVEAETLACGTGVTAAALAAGGPEHRTYIIPVHARGGDLEVKYDKTGDQEFRQIWLCGPATFVFQGEINLD
ncbi:MAG TPA: diaminopimelate epimerase [Chitinophagaceae bacterium]|nr:diaminopimelate epimerase [Chitinophagaceae bacterium]